MLILNGDYIYFAASFSVSFPFVMLAMDVGNPPSPRGVIGDKKHAEAATPLMAPSVLSLFLCPPFWEFGCASLT